MPEAKSVLILPGTDVDEPTWAWVGKPVTNIPEYWKRWGKPLLECDLEKPVSVVLSVPSKYWARAHSSVKRAWTDEIEGLRCLFSRMMEKFRLDVRGPYDLTCDPPDTAVEKARQRLAANEQVLGAAHVPPKPGTEGYYFEVGQGGQLSEAVIGNVGKQLAQKGLQGHRAIFVGCETFKTLLPDAFVNAGVAIVFLATVRTMTMEEVLALLKAVIVVGYDVPGHITLDRIWATYHKIEGFPHTEGLPKGAEVGWGGVEAESVLILEGSPLFPNGKRPYYMAELPEKGRPLRLEPLGKDEVLQKARKTGVGKERLFIVDAPRDLRWELAEVLKGKPVLWVAFGASCASVAASLLQEDVEYHVGYVRTGSQHLIYRLLGDCYGCLSVQGVSAEELGKEVACVPEGKLGAKEFRDFVVRLASGGPDRLVVAGARP